MIKKGHGRKNKYKRRNRMKKEEEDGLKEAFFLCLRLMFKIGPCCKILYKGFCRAGKESANDLILLDMTN